MFLFLGFHLLTHTNHKFRWSLEFCDNYRNSLLFYLLHISPCNNPMYLYYICPCTRLPILVIIYHFCTFLVKRKLRTPPIKRRNSSILLYTISVFSCYLPSRRPILSRIWNHQSVSYWLDAGSFRQLYKYYLILFCFWNIFWSKQLHSYLCLFKILDLRGIESM